MDKKIISIGALVLVVIAGGAFYGGMKFAEGSTRGQFRGGNVANLPEGAQARFQQLGGMGSSGQRAGGGFAAGEILSKDDQSITLKLQDGGSKIVFLTADTPISKNVSGSLGDLTVGEQVTVTGSANQDGSISAQSVQIGTMVRTLRDSN